MVDEANNSQENNSNDDKGLDNNQENNAQDNQENKQEQGEKYYTEADLNKIIEDKIGGLKSKNQELLGKLKEQKTTAEQAQEDYLKANGKVEELEQFYKQRIDETKKEYEDRIKTLESGVKERDKLDIINKLAGDFVDSEAGSFMLKQLVDVEDGKQTYRDLSGNIVADNLEDFRKWLNTDPHMAHFVRGTKASGGNAQGGAGEASNDTYTKDDWNKLDPSKKMEVVKKMAAAGKQQSDYILD